MNVLTRQLSISIIGGTLLILVIVLSALYWWSWRVQRVNDDVGPTWRGLTVGQSTDDEVISALGSPTSVEQGLSGQKSYLYQEGRSKWNMHRIVTQNGVVEYIREDALAYADKVKLAKFIDQYGKPDQVLWSREGPERRDVIFLKKGIFVVATASSLNEAQVGRVFYYRPRSLDRLLVDFASEISPDDPFPDSDILGPKDPWFGTEPDVERGVRPTLNLEIIGPKENK
jgi:hypothetical protein